MSWIADREAGRTTRYTVDERVLGGRSLTWAWIRNMGTCTEALVLVWDRDRCERFGTPSIFD